MKLEQLPLWKRIMVGYVFVAILVGVCGFAGIAGILVLDHSVKQITGPVWKTADGVMDGSIQIQSQIIAAGNILDGIEVEKNEEALRKSQQEASQAFDLIASAELLDVDSVTGLQKKMADYEASLNETLQLHG